MKVLMIVITLSLLVGCASGPRTTSLRSDHAKLFRSAKCVTLDVLYSSDEHYKSDVRQASLKIKRDASVILGASGKTVQSPAQAKECVEIKIVGRWNALTSSYEHYGASAIYTMGSTLNGLIRITMPGAISYARSFHGKAGRPRHQATLSDVGLHPEKAYKNSNFVNVMSSLMSEVYGEEIKITIQKAIDRDKQQQLADRVRRARDFLKALAKKNEEEINKLSSYASQVGKFTIAQFYQDGWNSKQPYIGKLGIVACENKDGASNYSMGYFATSNDTIPGALSWGSDSNLDCRNVTIGTKSQSNTPLIPVCKLRFQDGVLKEIKWQGKQN